MENYITTIANREAIFTEDTITIGHLILAYDKMSNIKYRKGTKPGFLFDYENRNIFLPCGEEEKSAMMPFFQKVALLDRKRKEEEERKRREEEERRRQEEEQRRLEEERRRQEEEMLRKQREEQDALDTLDFLTEGMIEPEEPVEPEIEVETPSVAVEEPTSKIQELDAVTVLYGPPLDSLYPEEGYQDKPVINQALGAELLQPQDDSHGFVAQPVQEEPAPMEMPAMSIPSMENNFVEPEPLEIVQSVQQSVEPEPVPNDIFKPSISQQLTPEQSKDIDDVLLLQKESKPQIKPFWKVGRLVAGIISIILFGLMAFNLYHTGVINTLINYGHINNYSGLILAASMLIGGIVGAATCGSRKKIGCIISSVLYLIGAVFGGLNWTYSYIDGKIATIVLAVFALFYLFCAIKNPSKKTK